ncbi:MAG: hypothetical protein LQ346_006991 [Caloplaca aetnensis]|nr:MAG: hypothetical protein LQ346_006991 [Caloplaca aetnensis]
MPSSLDYRFDKSSSDYPSTPSPPPISLGGYGSPSINIVYGNQNAPYAPPYQAYQAPQQHQPQQHQPNSYWQQSPVPPSSQLQREQQPPVSMQDVITQLNGFLATLALQLQPRGRPAPPQQRWSWERASAANARSGERGEVQPVPTQAPAVVSTPVAPVAAASADAAASAAEGGSGEQHGRRELPVPAECASMEQQNYTRPDEARAQVDTSSQPEHVLPATVVQQISPSSPSSPSAALAGNTGIGTNRRGQAPYNDQDRPPPALPEAPNLTGLSRMRLGPSMGAGDVPPDPGTPSPRLLIDPRLGERHTREAKNRLRARQESRSLEPDHSGYGFQPRRGPQDPAPISSEPSPH